MEHPLSITWVIDTDPQGHQIRSEVTTVTAETNLGPSPQIEFPDSFEGKLVGVTPEQLCHLRFGQGVLVFFSSKRYKFSWLKSDGTFKLRKDW